MAHAPVKAALGAGAVADLAEGAAVLVKAELGADVVAVLAEDVVVPVPAAEMVDQAYVAPAYRPFLFRHFQIRNRPTWLIVVLVSGVLKD